MNFPHINFWLNVLQIGLVPLCCLLLYLALRRKPPFN